MYRPAFISSERFKNNTNTRIKFLLYYEKISCQYLASKAFSAKFLILYFCSIDRSPEIILLPN